MSKPAILLWRQDRSAPVHRLNGVHIYDDLDDRSMLIGTQETETPSLAATASKMVQARLVSDRGDSERLGEILLVVGFNVPDAAVERLDDWYETEHATLLLQAADWLRVRRYVVESGRGVDWTHIAVHDLGSLAALDSPQRAAAREGPKRQQFLAETWYQQSSRWMGRRAPQPDQ